VHAVAPVITQTYFSTCITVYSSISPPKADSCVVRTSGYVLVYCFMYQVEGAGSVGEQPKGMSYDRFDCIKLRGPGSMH
jgi:hypothetical protein